MITGNIFSLPWRSCNRCGQWCLPEPERGLCPYCQEQADFASFPDHYRAVLIWCLGLTSWSGE